MSNIDVDHWRNMQALLLESSKEKRRIIVIHEDGELFKFVHSNRAQIVRNIDRVENAQEAARRIYQANADDVDFVQIMERKAVEQYVGRVQDTWRADEDLDVYVQRMFAMLDDYPDGIVTYPGKARSNLGLQWRVGASHAAVTAAVAQYIPPGTTVVFGVFDGDDFWASLVLGFDGDRRINNITTVDPTELPQMTSRSEVTREIVAWVNQKYPPCSLGLFLDHESAQAFFAREDKSAVLRAAAGKGTLQVDPLPASLAALLTF